MVKAKIIIWYHLRVCMVGKRLILCYFVIGQRGRGEDYKLTKLGNLFRLRFPNIIRQTYAQHICF